MFKSIEFIEMLQMLFRLYPIICLARNSGGADCPCPVLLCFFINHEHLKQVYLNSVGNNTCLNLNIPPMPNGKFDENDVARLLEFGNWIKTTFSDEKDLFPKADVKEVSTSETQKYYDITFDGVKKISYIELCEDIAYGQRISSFSLSAKNIKNVFFRFADDTTIGHKKICRIGKETDSIRIYITGSRDVPLIKSIRIFEE